MHLKLEKNVTIWWKTNLKIIIITYSFWKFACLHVKSKTIHPKTAHGTRITAREEVDMTRAPLMIPKTTPISLQEANCINNQHDRALWKSRLGKYIWHGWRLGKKRFHPCLLLSPSLLVCSDQLPICKCLCIYAIRLFFSLLYGNRTPVYVWRAVRATI